MSFVVVNACCCMVGFTPLSSVEIKKDFHDIEHQTRNADDMASECSVKTEDALPSSYPVKPRKTIKPVKTAVPPQVLSLAQYYQQQQQQQQQQNQYSISDPMSVGPNQAKNKTTFVSYDKRTVDETLLMYQLIQHDHPDLWKKELAYEALSQKVQVSQVFLCFVC